jgi:DNA-binding FrmR family transcriptional regulator
MVKAVVLQVAAVEGIKESALEGVVTERLTEIVNPNSRTRKSGRWWL